VALSILYIARPSKTWEEVNREKILSIKSEADDLASKNRWSDAVQKYDELLAFVGSRQIVNHYELERALAASKDAREQAVTSLQESQAKIEKARQVLEQAGKQKKEKELQQKVARDLADRQRFELEEEKRKEREVEAAQLNPEQIVSKFDKGVALVRHSGGTGTGFLIAAQTLVTNYHVIRDAPMATIKVRFPAVSDKAYDVAQVLYEDESRDLAILKLAADPQAVILTVANKYEFKSGQAITVIGNPGMNEESVLQNAVSVGVMSTKTTYRKLPYYQMSIAINSGNSGGPVFDNRGQVIGVATLKATKKESIAFCIPSDVLQSAIQATLVVKADEIAKNELAHDMKAVVRRLSMVGLVYSTTMELYVETMDGALKAGLSASSGLQMVQSKMEDITKKLGSTDDIKSVVRRLGGSSHIPDRQRTALADLWTNFLEMKDYVENPRGNFSTYRTKQGQLSDKHKTSLEQLKVLLGMPDDGD
jgi:S1-C subfamily serine protease